MRARVEDIEDALADARLAALLGEPIKPSSIFRKQRRIAHREASGQIMCGQGVIEMHSAFRGLSVRQDAVIEHRQAGYSIAETASRIGCHIRTVRREMHRIAFAVLQSA